jgi:hypothetical protein
MHEPDGVAGVSAIRKAEPSLKEQILEHESIGLLRDATACYDRAIQLEPDQVMQESQGALTDLLMVLDNLKIPIPRPLEIPRSVRDPGVCLF